MLLFLLGFMVGAILGIILMAILIIGSIADRNTEYMMRHFDNVSQVGKQIYN